MWKKWKRNKGSLVIESAFVYPITFFVIFFLIYMGNIHFLKARIQTIVSNEAVRYAAYFSDPMLEDIMKNSDGEDDFVIPTSTSDTTLSKDLYRYINVFDNGKASDTIVSELKKDIETTGFFHKMTPGNISVKEHQVNNYIIYQTYSVEVSYQIQFPIKFIFMKDNIVLNLSAREETPVVDSPEFIRNIDMALDYLDRLDSAAKVKEGYSKFYDKIQKFIEHGVKGEKPSGATGIVAGGTEPSTETSTETSTESSTESSTEDSSEPGTETDGTSPTEEATEPETETESVDPNTLSGKELEDYLVAEYDKKSIDEIKNMIDTSDWDYDMWEHFIDLYTEPGANGQCFTMGRPKNPTAYTNMAKIIGKDNDLSDKEKYDIIHAFYEQLEDKSDVGLPKYEYIDGFDENGYMKINWPNNYGFDKSTMKPISSGSDLPDEWDRVGSSYGFNFASVENGKPYTNDQRAIPYEENSQAYHSGKVNTETYTQKIDAIVNGDRETLNSILQKEHKAEITLADFNNLVQSYNENRAKINEEVGYQYDTTYGMKGNAASWHGLSGGATQFVVPLSVGDMKKIGILEEES